MKRKASDEVSHQGSISKIRRCANCSNSMPEASVSSLRKLEDNDRVPSVPGDMLRSSLVYINSGPRHFTSDEDDDMHVPGGPW